jgi:YfiH family protein
MQIVKANWPELADQNSQVIAFTTMRKAHDKRIAGGDYGDFNLGLHVGDDLAQVLKNRDQLMQYCQLEDAQWLEQVHGVQCVKAQRDKQIPVADACWTDEKDFACIVMTADCLPVAVRQGKKIAVAHAGWRGLLAGVLDSTLQAFDTSVTDIWLGPAIGPNAFEVGEEVREQFVAENSANADAFEATANNGKWLADIYLLAKIRLVKLGIQAARIYGEKQCTYSDNHSYYSYRRHAQTGRMATVIYRTTPD